MTDCDSHTDDVVVLVIQPEILPEIFAVDHQAIRQTGNQRMLLRGLGQLGQPTCLLGVL